MSQATLERIAGRSRAVHGHDRGFVPLVGMTADDLISADAFVRHGWAETASGSIRLTPAGLRAMKAGTMDAEGPAVLRGIEPGMYRGAGEPDVKPERGSPGQLRCVPPR